MHEERHAEDGEDEHDQEQQQTDVEQRRQGHGQRKQQRSDTFGALDETQHTTDLGHSDDSEQRGRHEVLLDEIAKNETCEGGNESNVNLVFEQVLLID